MLTILLLTAAHAQESFPWVDDGARYPNVVLADLDGDGFDDLAIGTLDRCGAVEVWLSSVDPWLGLLGEGDEVWLERATVRVAPSSCEPTFGVELAVLDGVLGTSPDKDGVPTGTVVFRGAEPTLELTGDPAAPTSDATCEPCCGPAPCCVTGSVGTEFRYVSVRR